MPYLLGGIMRRCHPDRAYLHFQSIVVSFVDTKRSLHPRRIDSKRQVRADLQILANFGWKIRKDPLQCGNASRRRADPRYPALELQRDFPTAHQGLVETRVSLHRAPFTDPVVAD